MRTPAGGLVGHPAGALYARSRGSLPPELTPSAALRSPFYSMSHSQGSGAKQRLQAAALDFVCLG
jgi:hypothetical protein